MTAIVLILLALRRRKPDAVRLLTATERANLLSELQQAFTAPAAGGNVGAFAMTAAANLLARLAALHPSDRQWLLSQTSVEMRARLTVALESGHAAAPRTLSAHETIASATPEHVARALQTQPAWLAAGAAADGRVALVRRAPQAHARHAASVYRAALSSTEARIGCCNSEEFCTIPGSHRGIRPGIEPALAAVRSFAPAPSQKPQSAGVRILILRDAIVSSERHRLGVVESALPEARREPLRPALTVSEVCAWLMGEGEVARRACASELAPELEELRKAARAEGYADGRAAAMREVEERHTEALESLAAVVRAAEVARERAADELTNTCAAIVAEAFAKMAGELLTTPAATLGAVRSVLDRVRDGRRYTVYVHPSTLAAVETERANLQAAIGDAALDVQG